MTQLVITGAENITIDEKHITKMGYRIVTPEDSNARSTDVSKILWIEGRIIPEIAGTSGEPVAKLQQWSYKNKGVSVYCNAVAQYDADATTVRKYTLPKAFVYDYHESFSDTQGTGTFRLELCQKKDENNKVTVEGGFAAE